MNESMTKTINDLLKQRKTTRRVVDNLLISVDNSISVSMGRAFCPKAKEIAIHELAKHGSAILAKRTAMAEMENLAPDELARIAGNGGGLMEEYK